MKSTLLLLLLIFCRAEIAFSQNFAWAKQAGGPQNDYGTAISADLLGNSYVTGAFRGTINFPGVSFTSVAGSSDVFVAKYDKNGNFLWAKAAGGPFPDEGDGISVDSAGNVYVTGVFSGTLQFVGGPSITSSGNDDIFIAKYNGNGLFLWGLHCGGTGPDGGNGIAASSSGNIYVTGGVTTTPTFNSTSGASTSVAGSTGDVFVACYNSLGVLQWVKRAGGTGSDLGVSISVDANNNSYVTGSFTNSFNWGGTTVTALVVDGFVAKYNSLGSVQWVRTMKGPGWGSGLGISVDAAGGPYVAGFYTDAIAFNGSGVSYTTPGNGFDIFIARYTTNGQLLWARHAGGTGSDRASGISVRGTGDVLVTGMFSGIATFGNQQLNSWGGSDIFVARCNPNGTLLWLKQAGGAQSDDGRGIAVDEKRAYVTGGYQSSNANFPTAGSLAGGSPGNANFFVARIP
jgi:hypothetical protein